MSIEAAESQTLFSSYLRYMEVRDKQTQSENEEKERKFKLRTQKILEFHERQVQTVSELRRRLEYISNHAHTIGSALRAASSESRAVPLSNALINDLIQIRASMEESIRNAHLIKNSVAANYQPFMDNILAKLERELYNWSKIVNSATQALNNSKAFMENIQNLLIAQQQICSEVAASELFQSAEQTSDVVIVTPKVVVDGTDGQRRVDSSTETIDSTRHSSQHFCSTPNN